MVAKVPDMEEILKLFNRPPVYDLASGLSYKAYSDIIKVTKGGPSGYGVNVYDNGILVEGRGGEGSLRVPDPSPRLLLFLLTLKQL